MEIKAADVMKLRHATNAGMMDCKKALQEAEGDFDKAVDIIRKRGLIVASKRADREAKEGCVLAHAEGKKGVLVSLNCETDFVAKNENFINFTKQILDAAFENMPADKDALLALQIGGRSIADQISEQTGVIGEKLEPRYFRKGAEEGKRYTVDEAWFSYKDGLCLVNQKRTYRDGAFNESEDSDSRCIYDMLSILAQARSYDPADYKVGDKIKFPMATGRKVEEQTLIYRGKENVKAENGVTYRCLIFSLVEYDKKGKEKEVITFFVTDDLNHLPVRLDLFLNFGSAKAFLNNVTGNRHPLTSVVK